MLDLALTKVYRSRLISEIPSPESRHLIFQSNSECHKEMFERETVIQQLRSLQVLESVHLMAGGTNET